MPRVVARYIDRKPLVLRLQGRLHTARGGGNSMLENPAQSSQFRYGGPAGCPPFGQPARSGFDEARHGMASVVQAPMIQAPAIPAAALAPGRDLRLDLC